MIPTQCPRLVAAAMLLVATGCGSGGPGTPSPGTVEETRLLMGTRFHVRVATDDAAGGREAVAAALDEVARVEAVLSEWREDSEISEVNRRAGGAPVHVGPELLEVVERSIVASERTGGAFDITFAGCGRLWSIRERRIPDDDALADCLAHVDYRRIEIDPAASTIRLPDPQMRIGISGIGKGYGVDRAAAVLEERGFTDWFVDGGGDVRIRGHNGDRPWSVGIADPRRPETLWGTLSLDHGAIVTSGDYMNYFERDGVRYHHILDPTTGRPARRSVAVTVTAPTVTDADALATGLFVLGPRRGIEVAESLPGVEALIFGPDLAVSRTSGFPETHDPPAP